MFAPVDSSSGFHFRRYNAFILLLGMVRPMQVDGIWERDGLLYNPFMARLLSRKEYYVLRRNIRPDVVELLKECNGQWAGAWRLGGAACGDESVVPHKGIPAGPLGMFIARKPHSTGIKLYCLADATSGYVVDMYLYMDRRGHLRRFGNSAGNYNAEQIMTMWAGLLPSGTIVCADFLFGSHELARDLAAERHAFSMTTKRSTYGVDSRRASRRRTNRHVHCGRREARHGGLQEPKGGSQAAPRSANAHERPLPTYRIRASPQRE